MIRIELNKWRLGALCQLLCLSNWQESTREAVLCMQVCSLNRSPNCWIWWKSTWTMNTSSMWVLPVTMQLIGLWVTDSSVTDPNSLSGGPRYTPLGRYTSLAGTPPWQVHTPLAGTSPSSACWDMVNKQAVRILLECIPFTVIWLTIKFLIDHHGKGIFSKKTWITGIPAECCMFSQGDNLKSPRYL